ncbi:MAG: type II secretion system protein GspJ [Gammaproteobacteria bacterium]|nr:type II secretion system protein GspJ [Gammaproteobacteria bacterium]
MRRQTGFTLLEILVATAILAIMGAMAYRAVAEARIASETTRAHLDRLREVQRAFSALAGDLRGLVPRPVREPVGDGYRPALLRDPNAASLLELSRGGWPNGAGLPRGTVQRVRYSLNGDLLVRAHWTVTDPTLASEPTERRLLGGVRRLELRFLDRGREWVSNWPPPGSHDPRLRPLAVEIVVTLEDYGAIRRVFEVAG